MDAWDVCHAQYGAPLIRADQPHLEDDPDLWSQVWSGAGEMLLADWIGRNPGTRPPAWHRFDCDEEPAEGEGEADFLDRIGELSAEELEGIHRKVLGLVEYDRGRRPEVASDNFIPAAEIHRFAARKGLLTETERAVLGLDGRGEPAYR